MFKLIMLALRVRLTDTHCALYVLLVSAKFALRALNYN